MKPHPRPLSILEKGGRDAISEPVKDWTTRQKVKNWTDFEGETGRTIGQKVGQRAPRAAGQYRISIAQAGGLEGERAVEQSDAIRQGQAGQRVMMASQAMTTF